MARVENFSQLVKIQKMANMASHEIDLDDNPSEDISIRTSANGLPLWVHLVRYGFQCLLTLMVMSFCIGACIYDLIINGAPTAISNMAFPTVAATMTLHFQLKSATRPLKALCQRRQHDHDQGTHNVNGPLSR